MISLKNTITLLIVSAFNAYLITQNNVLGKLGLLIYDYKMLRGFGPALFTVVISVGLCYGLAGFLSSKKAAWAKWLLVLGLVFSVFLLISTVIQFSGGSYAKTGTGFKVGMQMLPGIMSLLWAAGIWQYIANTKNQ
jgi:hypothetical protein